MSAIATETEVWRRRRRSASAVARAITVVGLVGAVTAAVVWGNPFGADMMTTHLGRLLAVGAPLLVVLILGAPAVIAWESRATPTPPVYSPLNLAVAEEVAALARSPKMGGNGLSEAEAHGNCGLVTQNWCHLGPVVRVSSGPRGLRMEPSRWMVVGRRYVPTVAVPWRDVVGVELVPAVWGGQLVVVTIRQSGLRFALWLPPNRGIGLRRDLLAKMEESQRPD